ncbi:MAG: YceI family protein [Opitutales bacterium]
MKTTVLTLSLLTLALAAAPALAHDHGDKMANDEGAYEVYVIDPVHSGISFKIRHFFTKVPGSFGNFEGKIKVDRENIANSKVMAAVTVASINTNNQDRDEHLRSDDFFGVESHPEATFTSTQWEQIDGNTFKVTGDLTLMGTTQPVTLDVELLGFGEGRNGAMLAGWDATTTLDRTDWGMSSNPVLGDEVDITINIQAKKQES